jgi:ATP-dependent helicase/nuclease subunit A
MPAETVRTFRLSSVPSRPAFLEEEQEIRNAANIGTATHRFLHLIQLEALRKEGADVAQAVRAEMERMREERILSREEAEMIRLGGVVSFFAGDLGQRMLRSPEVKREATFSMRISRQSSTVVQGIIDCVFREGDGWILIDYKTDHDTAPETFVPRHEMQMNWYRAALERLTRVRVREMWLFALSAGRAYPVERREIG